MGVEDGQGRAGPLGRVGVEAPVQPLVEGRIGRAVVHEGPAEGVGVEGLGRAKIGGGQFEVVEFSVFTHG